MKTILTLALSGITSCVISQSVRSPVSNPYTALSAYSTRQNDAVSFTGNQAALAQTKNAGMGVYAERRFMLADINAYVLAAALPTTMGNFGIQLNYAGFKNFNENKIGLAYARSAGNKADIGIQFNYYSYRIPGYAPASAIYAEAGVLLHVTDKLNAGVHVYNPVGTKLGKEALEKLPAAYKFGWGYDASEQFFASAEICKEEGMPVNIIAGVQYQFAKQFFARAGFLSETATAFAGFGVSWKNIRADVTGSWHPQLGLSPGLLLLINFNRTKN